MPNEHQRPASHMHANKLYQILLQQTYNRGTSNKVKEQKEHKSNFKEHHQKLIIAILTIKLTIPLTDDTMLFLPQILSI